MVDDRFEALYSFTNMMNANSTPDTAHLPAVLTEWATASKGSLRARMAILAERVAAKYNGDKPLLELLPKVKDPKTERPERVVLPPQYNFATLADRKCHPIRDWVVNLTLHRTQVSGTLITPQEVTWKDMTIRVSNTKNIRHELQVHKNHEVIFELKVLPFNEGTIRAGFTGGRCRTCMEPLPGTVENDPGTTDTEHGQRPASCSTPPRSTPVNSCISGF